MSTNPNAPNKLPYITTVTYNGTEYTGVLKIKSKQYITLYCFDIAPEDAILSMLELAEQWWWQSNRIIPISLFMREEMENFEIYTKRFSTELCLNCTGPLISLSELPTKRIKRRNITLKRK